MGTLHRSPGASRRQGLLSGSVGPLLKHYRAAKYFQRFSFLFAPLSYIAMVALLAVGALSHPGRLSLYAAAGVALALLGTAALVASTLLRSRAACDLADWFYGQYGTRAWEELPKYTRDRDVRAALDGMWTAAFEADRGR